MERSAPEGGLLEVEGRQLAAVRQLQQPARWIIGERRSRSGEVVDVDRVASTEILELRAEYDVPPIPVPNNAALSTASWLAPRKSIAVCEPVAAATSRTLPAPR